MVFITPFIHYYNPSDTLWRRLHEDLVDRISIRYGITGNGPKDCLADTGECRFVLRNQRTIGDALGYYSPLHANAATGWTHGALILVAFSSEAPVAVSSLTRSSTTATCTTSSAHGFSTGDWVTVVGADEVGYDRPAQITVTGGTTFTYPVAGSPDTPATGDMVAYRVRVRFVGRIESIDPDPGINGSNRVQVVAYDYMREIHDTELRDIGLQVNKTEAEIINTVLGEVSYSDIGLTTDLDDGIDLLQYALDNIGNGAMVGAVLRDVIFSSYGLGFMAYPGGAPTFKYISRNTRATTASSATLSDSDLYDLRAPSSRRNVYNNIRVTTHPRSLGLSNQVVWELTGNPPLIPGSDSVTFDQPFRDPNDPRRLVGATNLDTSLDSGTDYIGNSQIDGLGTSLTANLTPTVTAYASRATVEVANGSATPAYLADSSGNAKLQIRGQCIYDDGPRVWRKTGTLSDRPIDIDLPYQADDVVGQQIAEFILDQYEDLSDQVDAVTIKANRSDTLAGHALTLEPGDVITISETMTGLSSVDAMILSVSYEYTDQVLTTTWGLGPVVTIDPPAAPSSLSATVLSDNSVRLSWSMGQAGAQTQIFQDGLHVATVGADVTSVDIFGLTRGTTYTFKARHLYFGLQSVDSNEDTARPVFLATGGTIVTAGGFRYHLFVVSDTFDVTQHGTVDDIWIISGGGGGGGSDTGLYGGGGGGAGGIVHLEDEVEPVGNHVVVVGAGGAGGGSASATPSNNRGGKGSDSEYRTTASEGGGYGAGAGSNSPGGENGGSGGSGGGGSVDGTGGTGNEGNNGGNGAGNGFGNANGGGGGGGFGSAGSNGTLNGGNGGTGLAFADLGATYAAGGKGGRGTGGAGENGVNAGDGGNGNVGANGGSGKSGIVVIRYLA